LKTLISPEMVAYKANSTIIEQEKKNNLYKKINYVKHKRIG